MKSLFSVFKKGLQKTSTSITRSIGGVFSGTKVWTEDDYEMLEAALISADFGVNISLRIVDDIRDRYSRGLIKTSEEIVKVAHQEVMSILGTEVSEVQFEDGKLNVILFVGVNGSGKTTTIGKLAQKWKGEGKKVMLAACDTWRAAAAEQLKKWGERTDVQVVSSKHGADPSAVAYDAVESALAKNADILIIDTAGRQHTSKGLMEELAKMTRTIKKVYPEAPQHAWLTVDSSLGGNAIVQAREFSKFADLNGLVITKLDGTGKGGTAVAIKDEFDFPIYFVGMGEQPDDLQPFDPEYYTTALFGEVLQEA